MPDRRRATCRRCRRHRDEAGELSWSGLCVECGPIIFEANARSIAAKTGPGYLHQQRRILMQAYAALLDAERSSA